MEENSEVLAKYQKLALEYSKLKAQSSVLKSAFADEQATVAELQETLKKKDQLVRKLEQEVECLNFRNLQLTKRVSILQNDLEGVDANPKHSKLKHNTSNSAPLSESYGILNIELQSRIEENEKLHKQIYAADLEHRKELAELTSTIEKLQSDFFEQDNKLNENIKEQEAIINSLQKEKIKMQVCIKNHEQELKDRKMKEETDSRDTTFEMEDLTSQLEAAKIVITSKVLFNDTCTDLLNSLNVPIIQRGKHEQLSSLMLKMQMFISDLSRQFSDLYTFMIQRLCSPSDCSIKLVVIKLELYLRESIPLIKAIPLSFEKIVNSIKDETLTWDKSPVLDFSSAFQRYIIYLDKLLPYLSLRIEDKESWTGSSPKVMELSPKLISICKKLVYCLQKLNKYIQLLAEIGSAGNNIYCATQPTVVKKILQNLESLQNLFDESRKLFGTKIAADHQLPMVNQSEKSTDECILSTLVSISSSLKKIADLMEKDLDVLSYDVWYSPRNTSKVRNAVLNPSVWQFKERGSKFVQRISQSEAQSIPYEVALKNYQTLRDHADNNQNLTQQLEHYQNKLMQLELDKENWMLECQLMKAKETKNSDSTPDSTESKAQGYDEIHLFVKNTVNVLVKQIQFADSKCIAFRNECETLHQKMKMILQKKDTLEKEVAGARQTIDRLKEEQKTLMSSYEDQLNTMSEHLANLNETLTAQKDEIDALKQVGTKGSKKGKSK